MYTQQTPNPYGSLPFSISSLTIVDLCTRIDLPM